MFPGGAGGIGGGSRGSRGSNGPMGLNPAAAAAAATLAAQYTRAHQVRFSFIFLCNFNPRFCVFVFFKLDLKYRISVFSFQ